MTCNDIDECSLTGSNKVCDNANCQNTHGSYICACNDGFKHKYDGDDTSGCDDIDECKDSGSTDLKIRKYTSSRLISIKEGSPCDSTSTCVNTIGSYRCDCNTGYIKKDGNCVNIDECSQEYEQYNDCGPNTDCFDSSPGRFRIK